MELQGTWGMAMFLIALAAAHAAEETVAGLRSFDASRGAGDDCCPAMERASLVVRKVGLFLLLAALAASGVLVDAFWMWIALGIIAATVVRHAARSLSARAYTPGVATSAALVVYVAWLLGQSWREGLPGDPSAWGAMVLGIAFIAINDLGARRHADTTSRPVPEQTSR